MWQAPGANIMAEWGIASACGHIFNDELRQEDD